MIGRACVFVPYDVCALRGDTARERMQVVLAFGTEVLDQLACVQNDRAYDITLSGINTWFEATSVEPHVSCRSCYGLRLRVDSPLSVMNTEPRFA